MEVSSSDRILIQENFIYFEIGIDPFCTIAMGKEKFVTAVREKTTSPDWHEQCDM